MYRTVKECQCLLFPILLMNPTRVCNCHSRKFSFNQLLRFLKSPLTTTTAAYNKSYRSTLPSGHSGYHWSSEEGIYRYDNYSQFLSLLLCQSKFLPIRFLPMSAASSSSSVRTLLGSRSQTLASFRCARTKLQRVEGGSATNPRGKQLTIRLQPRICSSCSCRNAHRTRCRASAASTII